MSFGWKNDFVAPETRQLMDRVLDAAFRVHRGLGPGLLESVYRRCLVDVLRREGHVVEDEVWMPITFEGSRIETALRVDVVVDGMLIVEVKAVDALHAVHRAQLRSYLKISGMDAGVLLNFNVAYFRTGFDRMVNPDILAARPTWADVADPRTRGDLLTVRTEESVP